MGFLSHKTNEKCTINAAKLRAFFGITPITLFSIDNFWRMIYRCIPRADIPRSNKSGGSKLTSSNYGQETLLALLRHILRVKGLLVLTVYMTWSQAGFLIEQEEHCCFLLRQNIFHMNLSTPHTPAMYRVQQE